MEANFDAFWTHLAEWESEGLLPEWATDTQARSRSTRGRIMASMEALLKEHSFEEVSIQDIARGAGVSVGAVYARFPSKEAILLMLGMAVLDGFIRRFEDVLHGSYLQARSFSELARAYISTAVQEFTRHRALIREVRSHASSDPSLRLLLDRMNRTVHGIFLDRASEFFCAIPRKNPEACVNWALFAANAAAREAILAGALSVYGIETSEEELVDELSRMMVAYVGITDEVDE